MLDFDSLDISVLLFEFFFLFYTEQFVIYFIILKLSQILERNKRY